MLEFMSDHNKINNIENKLRAIADTQEGNTKAIKDVLTWKNEVDVRLHRVESTIVDHENQIQQQEENTDALLTNIQSVKTDITQIKNNNNSLLYTIALVFFSTFILSWIISSIRI